MTRLLLAGMLAETIATWSPVVQALAVVSAACVILVVTMCRSDKPAERLIALIKALRGR